MGRFCWSSSARFKLSGHFGLLYLLRWDRYVVPTHRLLLTHLCYISSQKSEDLKIYFYLYLKFYHANASFFISVINQLDAQNFCFTISLFHASTCFEHMCSSSGGQNCEDLKIYFYLYLKFYRTNASFFISVINQLDAQNFCFRISLFHASTCFEHMSSSSGGQNCITQPLVSSHLQVATAPQLTTGAFI